MLKDIETAHEHLIKLKYGKKTSCKRIIKYGCKRIIKYSKNKGSYCGRIVCQYHDQGHKIKPKNKKSKKRHKIKPKKPYSTVGLSRIKLFI